MDRSDFYHGQIVTQDDMDEAFVDVDEAIKNYVMDVSYTGSHGVAWGLTVAPTGPVSTNVSVAAGVAYDQTGDRVPVTPAQLVDCSVDKNGASTTVANPGEERWLSIFLVAARVESEPYVDDNAVPGNYRSEESFTIEVEMEAAAAIGAAVKPALRADATLLADARRFNADGGIDTAQISTTRREDYDIVSPSFQDLEDDVVANYIKNYETLEGLITTLPVNSGGFVKGPWVGIDTPYTSFWDLSPAAATNGYRVCSDGEQVYYIWYDGAGNEYLRAVSRTDGSQLWQIATAGSISFVHSDGESVYYADPAVPCVYRVARADGSLTNSNNTLGGSGYVGYSDSTQVILACSGGASFTSGDWVIALTPSLAGPATWGYDHSAAVNQVVSNGRYVFMGGVAGAGGFQLRRLDYLAGTVDWSVVVGATVNSIALDQDLLIAGHAAAAGKYLTAFSPDDGSVVWTIDPGSEVVSVHSDGRYIYAAAGNEVVVVSRTGHVIDRIDYGVITRSVFSDGDALFVAYDVTGGAVGTRVILPHVSRWFTRVAATAAYRRPFHTLALPEL